jgi:hypothetical protein
MRLRKANSPAIRYHVSMALPHSAGTEPYAEEFNRGKNQAEREL